MKDDLRKTLSSANYDVDRKVEKRRENIEDVIRNFYIIAHDCEQHLNFTIIQELIENYLTKKEERIRDFKWDGLDFYENPDMSRSDREKGKNDYSINIKAIASLENYSNSNSKLMKSIKLVREYHSSYFVRDIIERHGNNPIAIFKNYENEDIPATLRSDIFVNYGINFEFKEGLYNYPKEYFLRVNADIIEVEKLIRAILNDELQGIYIDRTYKEQLQERINKLQKMHKVVTEFKTLSEKNADIITLDFAKKFVKNYKRLSSGIEDDKTLHVAVPCCYYEDAVKDNKVDSLGLNNELLIQNFIHYTTYYGNAPKILLIEHNNGGKRTFLPMLQSDFKTSLFELTDSFSIKKGTLAVAIRQHSLEKLIRSAFDEECKIPRQ